MANETRIKIRLPNPPAGSSVARVVIEKHYHSKRKDSEEEVYFDYIQSCKDLLKPETGTIPAITVGSVAFAYDQCREDLADLFCSPPEIPPIESTQIKPEIISFSLNESELYPGEETNLSFSLRGKGYYSLVRRFFNDASEQVGNDSKLADFLEFSTTLDDQIDRDIVLFLPPDLAEDIVRTEYILTVTNNNDTEAFLTQSIVVKRRPPPGEESKPKTFQPDNDVSDAKKEIYYLSSNVVSPEFTLSDYSNSNLKNNTTNFNSDLIRENMGSFWILNNEETSLVFAKDTNETGKILNFVSYEQTANNIRPAGEQRWNLSFGNITEKVGYRFTEKVTGVERLGYINRNRIISQTPILDMVYSYQKPYSKKELAEAGILAFSSAKIEITPEYNYYSQKYEQIHYDIDENILPNIYFLNLNKEAVQGRKTTELEDDFTIDPDIRKLIVLDDQIPEQISDTAAERLSRTASRDAAVPNSSRGTQQNFVGRASQGADIVNNRISQAATTTDSSISSEPFETKLYYDYYLKEVKKQRLSDAGLLNRIKNTYIPYAFMNKMQQYNANSEMHPMKIEVSFSKPRTSTISSLLKNSKIGEQFMISCLTKFQKNETATIDTVKQEFDLLASNYSENTNRYIGLESPSSFTGSVTDEFVYLGDYRQFNNFQTETQLNKIDFAEFSDKLHYIIKQQMRTYGDILNGRKCFTETLYYRIEKKSADSQAVIQNIWIPNDPDSETIKYVDTQVKYDKEYTYTIYSYDFVLANSYKSLDQPATIGTINISNKPLPLLVENVFDRINATVKDSPPIRPSVQIYPYKGIDNKIVFLLGKNMGTVKQKEIIIRNEDFEVFQKIKDSQQNEENDLIRFSSDDIIKEYEIFRMEVPPKSYEDFVNARSNKVDTAINPIEPDKRSQIVSFAESIVPNKKYYYTFRCTDIHDQISNPSEIYEIEMINENGTIFLLSKIYEPTEHMAVAPSKSFNRFLMIKPNIAQEIGFDFEAENAKNAIEIKGEAQTTINNLSGNLIWNKKYKLRLVSKSTNKVYDINFKFGTETKIIE